VKVVDPWSAVISRSADPGSLKISPEADPKIARGADDMPSADS
jgi:hypothetical protein